jgi:hypothetical protein
LLSIRIDKYNSKEVKESIFLAEAREMQNQVLKAAEALQDAPATSSSNFSKYYHSLLADTGYQRTESLIWKCL